MDPDSIPLGLCGCGCGQRTNVPKYTNHRNGRIKGQPLRFLHGHWSRLYGVPPVHYGATNRNYNSGLCITSDGRAYACCRNGEKIAYSRALMAAHIGRLLSSHEIVHHINEDPTDDRIENLQIVTRAQHIAIHRASLVAGQRAASS